MDRFQKEPLNVHFGARRACVAMLYEVCWAEPSKSIHQNHYQSFLVMNMVTITALRELCAPDCSAYVRKLFAD